MNTIPKIQIREEWKKILIEEFGKEYFISLAERIRAEYINKQVFPPPQHIFRALELVAPGEVKVVILGQDPYHTPGVADGLAFSARRENTIPPSLQNIFKEIGQSLGTTCEKNPDLTRWAKQGVLLLNASLSVRSGEANSHREYGWHTFTDAIIRRLSETQEHIVFLLWGSFARKKEALIDWTKHCVLTSAHPSPLSAHRGFFGNNHFKEANEYLKANNRAVIDWQ